MENTDKIVYEYSEHRNRTFKYIFHFSDIHICNDRNREITIDAINIAVDRMKQIIQERSFNPDEILIIIAGDLFHLKTKYNIKDLPDARKFILDLSGISDVIIIPGNHDMNLNNPDDNDDLIGDLMQIIETDKTGGNIYYHSHSGVYIHGNVNIYHNSLRDKVSLPKVKNDNISVLILHETIKGSKVGIGTCLGTASDEFVARSLNDGRFGTEISEEYDYVLLGHIHEYQLITGNMAYCGSLCQHHTDESYIKGFLLWSIHSKGLHPEFIRVKTQKGYLKLSAKNNKLGMHDEGWSSYDGPVELMKAVIEYSDCSDEFIRDISADFAKKFAIRPRFVDKSDRYNSRETGVVTLDNISDVEKHSEFIRNKVIGSEQLRDDVINLHRIYWSKYSRIYPEKHTWSLVSLKWSNVYCYGAKFPKDYNYVNFAEVDGLVGIIADNGAGKSSIIDILLLVLFNKTSKDEKIPEDIPNMIMKASAKSSFGYHIEVVIVVDGVKYIISQKLPHKSNRQRECSVISVQSDGTYKNHTKESITETYKMLTGLIGDYDTFLMSSVSTQMDLHNISNISPAERRKYFVKMFKLDIFDSIYKEIKKIITSDKKQLELITSEIKRPSEVISAEIIAEKTKHSGYIAKLSDRKIKLSEYSRERDKLISGIHPGVSAEDLPRYREELAAIPINEEIPEESGIKLDDLLSQLADCMDCSGFSGEILTQEIEEITEKLEEYGSSKLTADELADIIDKLKSDLSEIVLPYSIEYIFSLLGISKGSQMTAELNKKILDLEEKIHNVESEISEKKANIQQIDAEKYEEIKTKEYSLSQKIGELKQDIAVLRHKIQTIGFSGQHDIETEKYKYEQSKLSLESMKTKIMDIMGRNSDIFAGIADIPGLTQSLPDISAKLHNNIENNSLNMELFRLLDSSDRSMNFADGCEKCEKNKEILSEKSKMLSEIFGKFPIEWKNLDKFSEKIQIVSDVKKYLSDLSVLSEENAKSKQHLDKMSDFLELSEMLAEKTDELGKTENILFECRNSAKNMENILLNFGKNDEIIRGLDRELSRLISEKTVYTDILSNSAEYLRMYDITCRIFAAESDRQNIIDLSAKLHDAKFKLEQLQIYNNNIAVKNKISEVINANKLREVAKANKGRSAVLAEQIRKCEQNIETDRKISEIDENIGEISRDIDEIDGIVHETAINISLLEKELSDMTEKENSRDKLQKKIKIYSEYLECIDRDKGIQNDLLVSANDRLQQSVNKVLRNFVNFDLEFKHEPGVNSKIYVYIRHFAPDRRDAGHSDSGDRDGPEINNKSELLQASGYQKFATGIAMRIALIGCLDLPSSDFLIIDEGFSSSDENNRNNVREFIQKIGKSFNFVLMISHLEEFQSIINYSIQISNSGGFSRVKFGKMPDEIITPGNFAVTSEEISLIEEKKQINEDYNGIIAKKPGKNTRKSGEDIFEQVGNKFLCKICNVVIAGNSRSNHLKSAKHKKAIQNPPVTSTP